MTALKPVAAQIMIDAPLPTASPSTALDGLQSAASASFKGRPMDSMNATTPMRSTLKPSSSTIGEVENPRRRSRGSSNAVGPPIGTPPEETTCTRTLEVNVRNPIPIMVTRNGLDRRFVKPPLKDAPIASCGLALWTKESAMNKTMIIVAAMNQSPTLTV